MECLIRVPHVRSAAVAMSTAMTDGGISQHEQLVAMRLLVRMLENADVLLEMTAKQYQAAFDDYLAEEIHKVVA